MQDAPTTTIQEYRDEMGTHPLGDLADAKAVGPYVVERYGNPIGSTRRQRQGEPVQEVLTVHIRDPDHWRAYRELMTEHMGDYGAREMFRRMNDQDTIREIVAEYNDD